MKIMTSDREGTPLPKWFVEQLLEIERITGKEICILGNMYDQRTVYVLSDMGWWFVSLDPTHTSHHFKGAECTMFATPTRTRRNGHTLASLSESLCLQAYQKGKI